MTISSLTKSLERDDIGTGASRMQAIPELLNPEVNIVLMQQSELRLTGAGMMSYLLEKGLNISDFKATKDLNDFLDSGSKTEQEVFENSNAFLREDIEKIKAITNVNELVSQHISESDLLKDSERVTLNMQDGNSVKVKNDFIYKDKIVHTFTDEEFMALSQYQEVLFKLDDYTFIACQIKDITIDEKTFKGLNARYKDNLENVFVGEHNGLKYRIRKKIDNTHYLTENNINELLNGSTIMFNDLYSESTQKTYSKYFFIEEKVSKKGLHYLNMSSSFKDPKDLVKVKFKKNDYDFDPYFSPAGRILTDIEIGALSKGETVAMNGLVSKKNPEKTYDAKIKFALALISVLGANISVYLIICISLIFIVRTLVKVNPFDYFGLYDYKLAAMYFMKPLTRKKRINVKSESERKVGFLPLNYVQGKPNVDYYTNYDGEFVKIYEVQGNASRMLFEERRNNLLANVRMFYNNLPTGVNLKGRGIELKRASLDREIASIKTMAEEMTKQYLLVVTSEIKQFQEFEDMLVANIGDEKYLSSCKEVNEDSLEQVAKEIFLLADIVPQKKKKIKTIKK